jgi:hypothetical protein
VVFSCLHHCFFQAAPSLAVQALRSALPLPSYALAPHSNFRQLFLLLRNLRLRSSALGLQRQATLPQNLFSHEDQQMQTAAETLSGGGWGGRLADKVQSERPPASCCYSRRSTSPCGGFPNFSLAGRNQHFCRRLGHARYGIER